MIYRQSIVDCARTLVGTPFRHMARTPGIAIDCLNVVGYVGLELGVEGSKEWLADESLKVYGRTPRPDIMMQKCDQYLQRIPANELDLGDIYLLAFKVFPQHFAIVSQLNPIFVIHAYPLPPLDKVVESRMPIAKSKIIRTYRFRGVLV